MKLKKGSYLYLIGMFFLYFSAFNGILSLALGVVYQEKCAGENPLLASFGSLFAGSVPALVMAGAFSGMAVVLATLILLHGLRSNGLSIPIRVVGICILPLSVTLMVLIWALFEQDGPITLLLLRLLSALPALALGISLICVSLDKRHAGLLTMIFGVLSGCAAFAGFGYEHLFCVDDSVFTVTYFLGWLSAFSFSMSMLLFYAGICLCVGGCERKCKRKKQ